MAELYIPSDNPRQHSRAESAIMRNEFRAISDGLSRFPDLDGHANKLVTLNSLSDGYSYKTPEEIGLITGIQTSSVSGLTGGTSTGDADLSLDFNQLTTETSMVAADVMVFRSSANNDHRSVTFENLKTSLDLPTVAAGDGLSATGDNDYVLSLDIDSLTAKTTLANADTIAVHSDDDSALRKTSFNNFKTSLGVNILDVTSLSTESGIATNDLVVFGDASENNTPTKSITFENLRTALNIPPPSGGTSNIDSIATTAGLDGGGSSGAVSLSLNLSELTAVTSIANSDTIPFTDDSDSSANKKITFQNFKTALSIPSQAAAYTGGTGINVSGSNVITVDLDEVTSVTGASDIDDDDFLVFVDESDSDNATKKISVNNFKTFLPYTSNTGDITAVTVANNSGLSGGANSGAVSLALDIHNLTTVTSLADDDLIAFSDESESSDPTKAVTLANLKTSLGISSGDITAVTTANTSGLSGGSSAGTVALKLDIDHLSTQTTIADDDFLAFAT